VIIGYQKCFYEVFSENICHVGNDEDLGISCCMGAKVGRSFALCHRVRNTLVPEYSMYHLQRRLSCTRTSAETFESH
jgi:hypothetical protein